MFTKMPLWFYEISPCILASNSCTHKMLYSCQSLKLRAELGIKKAANMLPIHPGTMLNRACSISDLINTAQGVQDKFPHGDSKNVLYSTILYRTVLYCIVSYCTIPYGMVWYRIASYHMMSYHTDRTLSYRIIPYLIVSYWLYRIVL